MVVGGVREHIRARTQDKAGGCMDIAYLVIRKNPIRENHVLIITMFLLLLSHVHTESIRWMKVVAKWLHVIDIFLALTFSGS